MGRDGLEKKKGHLRCLVPEIGRAAKTLTLWVHLHEIFCQCFAFAISRRLKRHAPPHANVIFTPRPAGAPPPPRPGPAPAVRPPGVPRLGEVSPRTHPGQPGLTPAGKPARGRGVGRGAEAAAPGCNPHPHPRVGRGSPRLSSAAAAPPSRPEGRGDAGRRGGTHDAEGPPQTAARPPRKRAPAPGASALSPPPQPSPPLPPTENRNDGGGNRRPGLPPPPSESPPRGPSPSRLPAPLSAMAPARFAGAKAPESGARREPREPPPGRQPISSRGGCGSGRPAQGAGRARPRQAAGGELSE